MLAPQKQIIDRMGRAVTWTVLRRQRTSSPSKSSPAHIARRRHLIAASPRPGMDKDGNRRVGEPSFVPTRWTRCARRAADQPKFVATNRSTRIARPPQIVVPATARRGARVPPLTDLSPYREGSRSPIRSHSAPSALFAAKATRNNSRRRISGFHVPDQVTNRGQRGAFE